MSKKVLVIGATGSQGIPVIAALLAPDEAGNPSPYSIRAFTRNSSSKKAQILASLPDIEVFEGQFLVLLHWHSSKIHPRQLR
jgi:uncharacterized protein YbjT (DUF2867 family)